MPTARPFAYNPSSLSISGTYNIGSLCIGVTDQNYSSGIGGLTWWNGADEDLGYVIAVPVSGNTQPTPVIGVSASVGFYRSSALTEASFFNLVNKVFNQNFSTGSDAAIWLINNGYWTNYSLTSNTDAYDYILQFVSAGGTIDSTTVSALDVLFNDLQNQNLQSGPTFYSALEGFYPMLGTTSTTQGINANGNTAYDLQFSGGWIFGSLGMQGNGINTEAYTGKDYIGNFGDELQNTHFSIYGTVLGNSPSNGDLAVNSYGGVSTRSVTITLNKDFGGSGLYEYDCSSGSDSAPELGSGDFVVISAQFGYTYGYRNGDPVSVGPISTLNSSSSLYLGYAAGSFFGGCTTGFGRSINTFGWSSFGTFMSSLDMATYQSIVNTFMTSIGRNTW
jgi:hypothetical protein